MAKETDSAVLAVNGLIDAYIEWKNSQSPPRGFERYHPSAFGKCLRAMQYDRFAERGYIPTPEDPKPAEKIRIFDNGHSVHERWRQYFEDMNILRGYWTCKNPMCAAFNDNGECDANLTVADVMNNIHYFNESKRVYGKDNLQGAFKPEKCVCGWKRFHYDELDVVSEELNFHGHADAIIDFTNPAFDAEKYKGFEAKFELGKLPTKPVVVDFKSCNERGFKEVSNESKGKPTLDYAVQLTVYANILDCEYGILIYESKNNQSTCYFKIDRNAETWWPQIVQQAKMMNEMVEVIDEDGQVLNLLPPPRPLSPYDKKCEWCKHKGECLKSPIWDDPNLNQLRTEFYGNLL